MIMSLLSTWSKWLKKKEFLDDKHLINLNCSYISLPVKFKVTGTETTSIPLPSYSRFFCRTLCDFQAAALSCSELVLILPQMAIVIKGT